MAIFSSKTLSSKVRPKLRNRHYMLLPTCAILHKTGRCVDCNISVSEHFPKLMFGNYRPTIQRKIYIKSTFEVYSDGKGLVVQMSLDGVLTFAFFLYSDCHQSLARNCEAGGKAMRGRNYESLMLCNPCQDILFIQTLYFASQF